MAVRRIPRRTSRSLRAWRSLVVRSRRLGSSGGAAALDVNPARRAGRDSPFVASALPDRATALIEARVAERMAPALCGRLRHPVTMRRRLRGAQHGCLPGSSVSASTKSANFLWLNA